MTTLPLFKVPELLISHYGLPIKSIQTLFPSLVRHVGTIRLSLCGFRLCLQTTVSTKLDERWLLAIASKSVYHQRASRLRFSRHCRIQTIPTRLWWNYLLGYFSVGRIPRLLHFGRTWSWQRHPIRIYEELIPMCPFISRRIVEKRSSRLPPQGAGG